MRRRRGFTLLEMFVAGALLVTLLMVCVQMLQATASQHRETRRHQAAVQAAANVMERLMARSYDVLTRISTSVPATRTRPSCGTSVR